MSLPAHCFVIEQPANGRQVADRSRHTEAQLDLVALDILALVGAKLASQLKRLRTHQHKLLVLVLVYRCGRYCARWTHVVDRRCARRRRRGVSTTRATVVAAGLASIRVVAAAVVLMCVAENVGRTGAGDDRCRRHRHGQIGHVRIRVVVVRCGEVVQRRDWLELCRLLLLAIHSSVCRCRRSVLHALQNNLVKYLWRYLYFNLGKSLVISIVAELIITLSCNCCGCCCCCGGDFDQQPSLVTVVVEFFLETTKTSNDELLSSSEMSMSSIT